MTGSKLPSLQLASVASPASYTCTAATDVSHFHPLGIYLCGTLRKECLPSSSPGETGHPFNLRTIILCLPSQASQFFASSSPHLSSTHLSIKAQGGILGHNAFLTGSLSEDVWGEEMCGLLQVQSSPDSRELRSQRRLNSAVY